MLKATRNRHYKELVGLIFRLLLCVAIFVVIFLRDDTPPMKMYSTATVSAIITVENVVEDLPPKTPPPEPVGTPPAAADIQARLEQRRRSGKATLGFVGDILIMQSQINAAKQDDGGYDFSRSFDSMRNVFAGVELMVGNLELPLAGAEAGYSQPRPQAPAPTVENPNPKQPMPSFNAPDELANNLRDAGFHVLTTANNHCLDRGVDGMFRTIDVVRNVGLMQTGTFLSGSDREKRLIVEVNGIKLSILAYTGFLNGNAPLLKGQTELVGLLDSRDEIIKDINACRDMGAEFIIVCVHWGFEYENAQSSAQEKTALWLAQNGADLIIGMHPHVVQPIEWIEAERGEETVRVPVVYSLGNFVANTSPALSDYGVYVQTEIKRGVNGRVEVEAVYYLPIYCMRRSLPDRKTLHEVIPCYENSAAEDSAFSPLDDGELRRMQKCREHVMTIIGTEAATPITAP